ncbi:MAG TPA: hypothetical protein PKM63_16360 [Panacibacter sp.]|nr:hypothetical protein [Panacibacter sp.]HNP45867.1 hypothetical protein [Panacibacter sp.]
MENDFREKQKKNYTVMRSIYNITIGIVITGIGVLMFLNEKIGLNLVQQFDPIMIYAFGGLCLLYGSFRLYRGIKKED